MELVINNGIEEIPVKNQNGDLITMLRINVADATTAERFARLVDNLNGISGEHERRTKAIDEKYKDHPLTEENIDTGQVIAYCRENVSFIKKCISEINGVFGADTVEKVYREGYERDPDFLPDEAALVDFVDTLIPIMTKLFNRRYDRIRSKYNAKRRGRHNVSKKELLEGMRNG